MKLTTLPPELSEIASQLYFRQSMIKDYLTCPQMMMYRWLMSIPEDDTFFSAVLGSAGHQVMYDAHEARHFDVSYTGLYERFTEAFEAQLLREEALPKLGVKFDSYQEQMNAAASDYISMLQGYMLHENSKNFYSNIHEQSFVLEIRDDSIDAANEHQPFIFTGTIDQAGYYSDGTLVLRDIKFRASNFKPKQIELNLDYQLTIYAYAMKFGQPSCANCRPVWDSEEFKFRYAGPCADCQKLIGTLRWPQKYPERVEMIWMRDFLKHKKDEYAQTIKDKTRKVIKPGTKRPVYPDITNPKWVTGYKAGDYCGAGFLKTSRSPAFLQTMMSDVIRICKEIRAAAFFRKTGSHCGFWCKHNKTCIQAIELDVSKVQQIDFGGNSNFATDDPFLD